MYGFNHRFHHSIKEALRTISENQLGRIINLRGVYGKSKIITFNQDDWRTKRIISGGGILLDQGIHMLDLMRLFAGDFVEIHSYVNNDYWGYDVEDNAYALMKTSNGIIGFIHSSATQWRHRFNLDINLEHGSIILGGILSGSKSYGAETLKIIKNNPTVDNGDPMEYTTRYNTDTSWEDEINLFTDCIINNHKISSGSSYDALKTMEHVFKIYYADPVWRNKYLINKP